MALPFHQEQLDFIMKLASHRVDFLNPFFRFLNYFDSDYFFFILIPFIWLGVSYQWGLRIYYWSTLNHLINLLAKNAIGWPRPSQVIPDLGMIHPDTYGFPSGAAETSLFLGAILIYYCKTTLARIIAVSYILLISFSRLYLGVHYPIDLVGGWAIALILFTLFVLYEKRLENNLTKVGYQTSLFLSIVIPLAILIIAKDSRITYILSATIAIGIGTYFSLKNHLFLKPTKKIGEQLARALFGILILFILYWIWPADWPRYTKSFGIALFMSLGVSPMCKGTLRSS